MNSTILKQEKLLESALSSLKVIKGYEHDLSKINELAKAKCEYANAITVFFQEVSEDLKIRIMEPAV